MSLRRFASPPLLFVTLWALLLLCPLTRFPALSQWKARLGAPSNSAPDSRDAQYVRALNAVGATASSSEARAESFRDLGRKFPNDPAICAAQIVNMSMYFRLDSASRPGPLARTFPGTSVGAPPKKTFDQNKLQKWIEAADRGAKLEPNNTFWDWAKLIGCLMKGNTDEGWSVLRAARGKTGYDDYVTEVAFAQIRVLEKDGPVPPRRQMALIASILLPHYAQMREAARQMRDLAYQLQGRSDVSQKKKALEGMCDLMWLARPMRRESKLEIGSIVGRSLEATALYIYRNSKPPMLTKPKLLPYGTPLSTYARDPRSLLLYARQMNRPDIVQQVSREWNEIGAWHIKTKTFLNSPSGYLIGVEQSDFWLAQVAHWVSLFLIPTIPTLLGVALVCSVLLAVVPSWKRERQMRFSPRSWLWGTMVGLFVLVAFLVSLFWSLHTALLAASSTVNPPLPLWLALCDYEVGKTDGQVPPFWQYHFPALLCLSVALWLAATQNERRLGIPSLGTRLRRILVAPDDDIARFDFSPLLSLAVTLALLCLATLGILGVLLPPTPLSRFFSLLGNESLVLFLVAALVIVPTLVRLRTSQSRALALTTIHHFAWSQLLFVAIVWGAVWLIAMPAQERFDRAFNRSLQIGDMQLLRKQLGL